MTMYVYANKHASLASRHLLLLRLTPAAWQGGGGGGGGGGGVASRQQVGKLRVLLFHLLQILRNALNLNAKASRHACAGIHDGGRYIESSAAGCSGFDLRLQLPQSVLHLQQHQLLFSHSCGC